MEDETGFGTQRVPSEADTVITWAHRPQVKVTPVVPNGTPIVNIAKLKELGMTVEDGALKVADTVPMVRAVRAYTQEPVDILELDEHEDYCQDTMCDGECSEPTVETESWLEAVWVKPVLYCVISMEFVMVCALGSLLYYL